MFSGKGIRAGVLGLASVASLTHLATPVASAKQSNAQSASTAEQKYYSIDEKSAKLKLVQVVFRCGGYRCTCASVVFMWQQFRATCMA